MEQSEAQKTVTYSFWLESSFSNLHNYDQENNMMIINIYNEALSAFPPPLPVTLVTLLIFFWYNPKKKLALTIAVSQRPSWISQQNSSSNSSSFLSLEQLWQPSSCSEVCNRKLFLMYVSLRLWVSFISNEMCLLNNGNFLIIYWWITSAEQSNNKYVLLFFVRSANLHR